MTRYGVIVADPAWRYSNGAGLSGAAEAQYPTMSTSEICALPVRDLAADDCVLFLWTTWPMLPDALRVVAAWDFEFVSGLPWVKIVGEPSIDLWGALRIKPQWGVGFWVRGCTEPLLICRRGKVSPPTEPFVGLLSVNFGHSRKPENVYHIAETLPGPRLEMFCRRQRPGWDAWGNQVESTARGLDAPTRIVCYGPQRDSARSPDINEDQRSLFDG